MANLKKNFSKIYDRYIDKIYRFIFFKVNSQEISEDLTSETFLRTWKVFKKGKEIRNIQAFLYKTARNLVIDYYRQKEKAQFVSLENTNLPDPRQDLEEKEALRSDFNQVKMALTKLREEYQEVIIWHYLNDLSIKEIAQILGRTEEATRVLMHRALSSLREKISQTRSSIA